MGARATRSGVGRALAYFAPYFLAKMSIAASAVERVSAPWISPRSTFIVAWTARATLPSTLAVLRTQQR